MINDAVFIWIPKNAGTSIYKTIEKNANAVLLKNLSDIKSKFKQKGMISFGHVDYSLLVKKGYISPKFDKRSFKFCFSRNPYERAVSLFSYLKKHKIIKDNSFLKFCIKLKNCEPIGLYNRDGISQCNPQITWIKDIKNLDYIGKVEFFEQDYKKLTELLEIKTNIIPHINKTQHEDYKYYYCSESNKIIKKFYEEDFDFFKYTRN